MPLPTLPTERLVLRPLTLDDANSVRALAGAHEVAAGTIQVPHPYEDGVAEAWIESQAAAWEDGAQLELAVTSEDGLVGAIALIFKPLHDRAELAYWMGGPFWSRGYATEAGRALISYGFSELDLHRITAFHFSWNGASGRVLQKLGMRHEGRLREHLLKWGTFEDVEVYGILKEEWARGG